VNPEVYLTDVLVRLQDHPADRVADLRPLRRSVEAFVEELSAAKPFVPAVEDRIGACQRFRAAR
jgi:hypothetical protein